MKSQPKRRQSKSDTLDFSDTRVAFSSLSDLALRRTWAIFRSMSSNLLVKVGPKLVGTALGLRLPITWAIEPTLFRQFCGGTSIGDCEERVAELHRYGIETTLDYAVESVASEEGFDAATAEIIRTVERARGAPEMAFCVFKATGIGASDVLEKVSEIIRARGVEAFAAGERNGLDPAVIAAWNKISDRVARMCAAAEAGGTRIFVDAEESWFQDAIDFLAEREMRKHNRNRAIVYTTFQMYRHDQLEHLTKLIESAKVETFIVGAKLVRGAYMTKERARAERMGYPSPIQATKADTDRDYDAALALCVANLDHVAICAGSHNESSALKLTELMQSAKVAKSDARIYFSQLMGMGNHISFNLAHHGYRVAKYVPYGPVAAVLPYLFRRAEENTSIAGQTSRELAMIETEIARRRRQKS